MTVNVSSKFKELILGSNSFADIFDGGRIDIFTGAQPASADHAIQGTLLASVTNLGQAWSPNGGAGGLNFAQSGVWMTNAPGQSWVLNAIAAGTAGWFRLYGPAVDPGALSFSAPRIDGIVEVGGVGELKLQTTALTIGYTIPLQQFLFSFPPTIGA